MHTTISPYHIADAERETRSNRIANSRGDELNSWKCRHEMKQPLAEVLCCLSFLRRLFAVRLVLFGELYALSASSSSFIVQLLLIDATNSHVLGRAGI